MSNIAKRTARTREMLASTFPKCFGAKRSAKRPLKVGIFEDLRAVFPMMNPRHLKEALSDYTGGPSYQAFLLEGTVRVDLQGDPAGVVTAEQAAWAKRRMADLIPETQKLWAEIVAQCLSPQPD